MTTNGQLLLFLLTADGLVRCRWDGRVDNVEILNHALDGETVREVARDPFSPKRLYAATLTEIHVSEDDGASWQWLPSGGIDHRDIWTMAVHPTASEELVTMRDKWVATAGPVSLLISAVERDLLEAAGAEEEIPDYWFPCD